MKDRNLSSKTGGQLHSNLKLRKWLLTNY